MNMPDFEMILNMDFLSNYRIKIDYRNKTVWLSLENRDKFSFGEGKVLKLMINSVEVRKILSKGCIGYLAHIVSKIDTKVLDVKDTSMVQEF